jgi:hypothetical protein
MRTRIWIRLYLEILDDAEFGMLPEFIKWRAVELFLVAGENGDDGLLPPVERLAWRLQLLEEKLEETLSALAQIGVVHETPQGWVVTNFKKRQYSESYERVKRYRERYRNGQCNEEVAGVDSTSESISDSGEGVQGEGLPHTPVEAMVHPDVKVFCAVTGGRVPGLTQYRQVIAVVRHLRKTKALDDQALAVYLSPFWLAWSGRKRQDGRPYDLGNITWLTEWAMNGSVPQSGKKKDQTEIIRRVARRVWDEHRI